MELRWIPTTRSIDSYNDNQCGIRKGAALGYYTILNRKNRENNEKNNIDFTAHSRFTVLHRL